MESNIIISVKTMYDSRNDMFTGVVLHPFKAFVPVDATRIVPSGFQGRFYIVYHFPILRLNIDYRYGSDKPGICLLSATLGKKCRLIKNDPIHLFRLFTG